MTTTTVFTFNFSEEIVHDKTPCDIVSFLNIFFIYLLQLLMCYYPYPNIFFSEEKINSAYGSISFTLKSETKFILTLNNKGFFG